MAAIRLLFQGVRDMRLHPLANWLAYSAVTLVVFLAGLFVMALSTVDDMFSASRGEITVQMYWRPGIDINFVRTQWKDLEQAHSLIALKTYTPEEALATLTRRMDALARSTAGGQAPDLTPEDADYAAPLLPPTALLTFSPRVENPEHWSEEMRAYLAGLPGVERVEASPLRDEIGRMWRSAERWFILPVVIFLCLVLGLVVGNTVRLTLVTRQREISILHLVGATPAYIRLPLLSSGGLIAALGAASGIGLLWLAHRTLAPILLGQPLFIELVFPPTLHCALLIAAPALMGVASAWLAVRRA